MLKQIASVFVRYGWLVVLIAIGMFTLVVVKPFGPVASKPKAADVASAWNESIAKLGITPVFPPEEDLYVGDIWAVVSDAVQTPLLGRAVRIGHIDLHDSIAGEVATRPTFPDTMALKDGDEYRRQDDAESAATSPDNRIHPTIAAFPGISISHVARAGSSGGRSLFGFGAARDDETIEELRIPVALTYGVETSFAGGRLIQWCEDPKTGLLCSDCFARKVLAGTVDTNLVAPTNGAFATKIELQLITRVFMTRTIEQRRSRQATAGFNAAAGGQAAALPAGAAPTTAPDARTRDAVGDLQQTVSTSAKDGKPAIASVIGNLAELQLKETFQRPVVFGFRSWNVQLDAADPKECLK